MAYPHSDSGRPKAVPCSEHDHRSDSIQGTDYITTRS